MITIYSIYFVSILCTLKITFHSIVSLVSCAHLGLHFFLFFIYCITYFKVSLSLDCFLAILVPLGFVRFLCTHGITFYAIVSLVSCTFLAYCFSPVFGQYGRLFC